MSYATVEDLTAVLGEANVPTDAQRQLDKASRLIDSVMVGVIYTTDDEGLPTEPDVIQAFKDATLSQVEYWVLGGGSIYGASGMYAQAQIGSVRLQRLSDNPPETGANVNGIAIAPDALIILRNAGALPIYPTYWG